jgi:hypothetical protein
VLQGDGYVIDLVVVTSIDLSSKRGSTNATQSLEREPPTKLAVEIPDFPGFTTIQEFHFSGDTISIDIVIRKCETNQSVGSAIKA